LSAQAEAMLRKSKKHIVQNQLLIQILAALGIISPFLFGYAAFMIVFTIPYGPLAVLISWLVLGTGYYSLYIYYHRKDNLAK